MAASPTSQRNSLLVAARHALPFYEMIPHSAIPRSQRKGLCCSGHSELTFGEGSFAPRCARRPREEAGGGVTVTPAPASDGTLSNLPATLADLHRTDVRILRRHIDNQMMIRTSPTATPPPPPPTATTATTTTTTTTIIIIMTRFCGIYVHLPVRSKLRKVLRKITGRPEPTKTEQIFKFQQQSDRYYAPDRIYCSYRSDCLHITSADRYSIRDMPFRPFVPPKPKSQLQPGSLVLSAVLGTLENQTGARVAQHRQSNPPAKETFIALPLRWDGLTTPHSFPHTLDLTLNYHLVPDFY
ncbi:hypothetical protein D0869_12329 [Hortaea werneckii]|uniref:Uncharacterized protein n=1 Tax=Hortaea werneckii TaxID=91943 RepID=A0A3M6W809_HORWE|nr:hypothetical protein D0869_12329 [Hortaea werneckii]